MPIKADLLNEINNAINRLPSNLSSISALDNIYEVYLFSLILKAAQNEGASVNLINQNNLNPTVLHFRASPGFISSDRHDYSFAEILFSNKPILEAHVSIRVSGHSHVLHECDICILYKSEADFCRRSIDRVAPRSSKMLINIEAKYYTTSVTLGLGRAFLGLTTDFSSSNSFFITNTSSNSIESLLSHKKKKWEHNILPSNMNELNRLTFEFQNVFKNFKAKII